MMIPGLSGGSFAMIVNIYEDIIDSLANFNIKKTIFLSKVAIGLGSGILFFSKFLFIVTKLKYFDVFVFALLGINILFLILKIKKIKFTYLILFLFGSVFMILIKDLNIFLNKNILMFLIVGFLIAISLVLPGLGVSYFLYAINMYEKLNEAIINFDILFLSLISISTILFIFLSSKIINKIIIYDKNLIYSLVIGLLVTSIF